MNKEVMVLSKDKPIRLRGNKYKNLCLKVIERDGHMCQGHKLGYTCTTHWWMLSVHHKIFRSQGGSDTEENLILLCDVCHKKAHGIVSKVDGGIF